MFILSLAKATNVPRATKSKKLIKFFFMLILQPAAMLSLRKVSWGTKWINHIIKEQQKQRCITSPTYGVCIVIPHDATSLNSKLKAADHVFCVPDRDVAYMERLYRHVIHRFNIYEPSLFPPTVDLLWPEGMCMSKNAHMSATAMWC